MIFGVLIDPFLLSASLITRINESHYRLEWFDVGLNRAARQATTIEQP